MLTLTCCYFGAAAAPTTGQAPGDGRLVVDGPQRGSVYACERAPTPTGAPALPWLEGGRVIRERKPVIDGAVSWPFARFELRRSGGSLSFVGNGLPVGAVTGQFPPARDDDAAPYAAGAPAVRRHRVAGRFPRAPRRARRAACVAADVPVAIALNGVPIMPAFGPDGLDAAAREVQDRCGGRTRGAGLYHYRAGAPCVRARARRRHAPAIAYARDGFAVHGARGRGGRSARVSRLDACHGHAHRLRRRGRRVYHYHVTATYPYVIGCFRGTPSRSWRMPLEVDRLSVDADPDLFPAFDREISDYVSRCVPGEPLRLSIEAPVDTEVGIDGGTPRGGAFAAEVGVAPEQRVSFEVRSPRRTSVHHVRCLPRDFLPWNVQRSGPTQAEWYLVTPALGPPSPVPQFPYVVVFDSRGVPVWWRRSEPSPIDVALLGNGNLVWARQFGVSFSVDPAAAYEERRLDGSLVRTWQTVGTPTDHHDLRELPNGNTLLISYRRRSGVDLTAFGGPPDATVLDGEIQEVEPDGDLAWSWNSKDHIGLEETGRWWTRPDVVDRRTGEPLYDIVHINSVESDGAAVIFSARHLDAVYRVSKSTGEVVWKLGGTPRSESLTIEGDPDFAATSFGGQHDARVHDDGTLSVHDNGTGLGRAPRTVRYTIDEDASTARLVQQLTDPEVPSSFCCGSSRRLPGGNWVMAWGGASMITELEPSGNRVMRIGFGRGLFSYRAYPVPFGRIEPAALRSGMDAMHPR